VTDRRARRGALAAAVATFTLATSLLSGGVAQADPDVGDDDVQAAAAAANSAAEAVAGIEVRLAEQSAVLDRAWLAAGVAGERYTRAVVARDQALAEAEVAADRAARAQEDVEAARDELGRIALEANRSGGDLDELAVLLSADGYQDFVARSTAIEQLADRSDRAVQRFEAAELVGRTLSALAEEAADAADRVADDAETALAVARQAQADAEQQVAEVAAERETLVAELARLRQTSIEIERARQVQIEAEQQALIDAAAQAQRAASVVNQAPPPSQSSTSAPVDLPDDSDRYQLGTGSQRGTAEQGQAAVAWALAQVGKPYVWGATGPDSFDCSGLVMRSWEAAGLVINRTSRDQYRQVQKITYESMRPGDLIFWGTDPLSSESVHHVAMYVGEGQMVEASRPGIPVRLTPIRWPSTMPYAGRP
jgi:cell wall-associated NlpC family hydrolase